MHVVNNVLRRIINGILNLSNSRSCYNESKRTSEAHVKSYIAEKNTKVKIARLCRIFGQNHVGK